jgi:hypothetical protein
MKLPVAGGEDIGDFVRWISGIDRFYRSATALPARRRALIEIRRGAVAGAHHRRDFEETRMAAVGSVNALLVRALAIEREAAERYAEFARFMSDHDRNELAALLRGSTGSGRSALSSRAASDPCGGAGRTSGAVKPYDRALTASASRQPRTATSSIQNDASPP